MLSLGPFPMTAVLVLLAMASAVGVAFILSGGESRGWRLPASRLLDLLLIAVVLARLGFVLRWWSLFAADPVAIVMIQDGGFLPWFGIAGALAVALWRTRREPALRRSLLPASLAGILMWWGLSAGLQWFQRHKLSLPDASLLSLAGQPVHLRDLSGQPMVLNLWATWCPPCRREMPVLAQAQEDYPSVRFVFVNQGEDADVVQRYLERAGLSLKNVFLDRDASLGQAIFTNALPASLFFDVQGRLVATHLGSLSAPGLAAKLQGLQDVPPPMPNATQ